MLGIFNMRTATQIGEFPLCVGGNDFAFGEVFDDLHLEIFTHCVKHGLGGFGRQFDAMDFQTFFGDLVHAVLDLFKVFRFERFLAMEVVEKSVLNDWTDGDLGFRIQLLHRLRHQMSATVTQGFKIVLFLIWIAHLKKHRWT